MGGKKSEKKKQKRLEKKKQKRKEKIKKDQEKKQVRIPALPVLDTFISNDWEESRYALAVASRTHPHEGVVLSRFELDLDGFGVLDAEGPRVLSSDAYGGFLESLSKRLHKEDPGVVSSLVHEAAKWARTHRFALPKKLHKAMEVLSEPTSCPVEFGRDGEPFLRGEEHDIKKRLAHSGHALSDFASEVARDVESAAQSYLFASPEYVKTHDKNDPLVRLERLAEMADGKEREGDLEGAEELHATMEKLAGENKHLIAYLRYYVSFQIRTERMEQALETHRKIVTLTDEPEDNIKARFALADFIRYLGDALEADEIYQKVLSEYPDRVDLMYRYAQFLAAVSRFEEAADKFRAIISECKEGGRDRRLQEASYRSLYALLKNRNEKKEAKRVKKEAKKELNLTLE